VIVLDASVVLEFLLGTTAGARVARQITGGASLHAPHLLDLEVTQVLRRYVRTRDVTPGRATDALDDLLELPLARYPHEPLLGRIWELRDRCTAYDAAYIALAEVLGGPLLTRDRALARAAPKGVTVVLV
jgi:predicted nucleic acid-binding protein